MVLTDSQRFDKSVICLIGCSKILKKTVEFREVLEDYFKVVRFSEAQCGSRRFCRFSKVL